MQTFIVREGDLPNIAKGALSTFRVPERFNSHGLMLECLTAAGVPCTAAEIALDVETVSVILTTQTAGSVEVYDDIPIEALFALAKWRDVTKSGYTYAGLIPLPARRDRLPFGVKPSALKWGMADVTNCVVQVKFKSPASLTIASIGVYNEIDRLPQEPLGVHAKLEVWEREFNSTGVEQVLDLPFGEAGTALMNYHVEEGSGAVDGVEVKHNGERIYEQLSVNLNNYTNHKTTRTPQSGWFHVDFQRDFGALPLGGVSSFVQKIDWDAAAAPDKYYIVTDMLYGLKGVA